MIMESKNITDEQELLFHRECALSAMSIGQGLSLIRKYEFVKHAYGTQAFFMLTIGIERLLKIILIYHFRTKNNNAFPNNAELKSIGHNLHSLYNKAKDIANDIGCSDLYSPLEDDNIFNLIIDFLSNFAQSARYYNLDKLTGFTNKFDEPLRDWNKRINSIIVSRHYRHNKKKAEDIKALSRMIGGHFLVSFNNEKGSNINNVEDFYLEGMTVNIKQKYSMFYLYCIVRFLSNLLYHLDSGYFPFVSEYFVMFRNPDDTYVKTRRTWNIYER